MEETTLILRAEKAANNFLLPLINERNTREEKAVERPPNQSEQVICRSAHNRIQNMKRNFIKIIKLLKVDVYHLILTINKEKLYSTGLMSVIRFTMNV